jgi:hypothetical protein
MSSIPYRIVIDDCRVGESHKSVLKYALEKYLTEESELIFASQSPIEVPKHWQVKSEVAFSLATKLWAIANPISSKKTLYLDGNQIIQGNCNELFQQNNQNCILASRHEPLNKLNFFLIDYNLAQKNQLTKRLLQLAQKGYTHLADFNDLDIGLYDRASASIIDCLALSDRPWYSVFAPYGSIWIAQLKEAIARGYLSIDTIEQDIERGLIRPSLLAQLKARIDNPFLLPKEIIALDNSFTPPELALSREQLQLIDSTIYPLPKRILTKVLFSRYFIETELPNRMLQVQRLWQKILGRSQNKTQ